MVVAAGPGAVADGSNEGEDEPDPEPAGVTSCREDLVGDPLKRLGESDDHEDHEVGADGTGTAAGIALVGGVLNLIGERDHVALDGHHNHLRLRLSGSGGSGNCLSFLHLK